MIMEHLTSLDVPQISAPCVASNWSVVCHHSSFPLTCPTTNVLLSKSTPMQEQSQFCLQLQHFGLQAKPDALSQAFSDHDLILAYGMSLSAVVINASVITVAVVLSVTSISVVVCMMFVVSIAVVAVVGSTNVILVPSRCSAALLVCSLSFICSCCCHNLLCCALY